MLSESRRRLHYTSIYDTGSCVTKHEHFYSWIVPLDCQFFLLPFFQRTAGHLLKISSVKQLSNLTDRLAFVSLLSNYFIRFFFLFFYLFLLREYTRPVSFNEEKTTRDIVFAPFVDYLSGFDVAWFTTRREKSDRLVLIHEHVPVTPSRVTCNSFGYTLLGYRV